MNAARPLEIVGGGLAGLALAGALRRAGAEVTLFEAGSYPRHRVCGEFIAGLSARTSARLGLAPLLADALRHREVAWCRDGSPIAVQPLPSPALGLSRYALDARLAEAFTAAGGDLRARTRVTDLSPRPGRIFATGRRAGSSGWLGLKLHALGLTLRRDLEVHLGDDAYVGLSAVEDGRVNVCGLFRRRRIAAPGALVLPAYLRAAGLGALADRLALAEVDPESLCAVAAVAFDRRVPAQDRVCLGDACAMIPPFTGNGMAMAFQSAEAALTPLLDYARGRSDWAAARQAIHAALRRRFRLRLASAGALHPYLLRPPRQRWLMAMSRAHLLPLRPLYAVMH
jgi:flavin-dependent dehydrogenase